MLYGFVKLLMTVAFRLFYRNIYVTGLESMSRKGPVILIANHSASLMDAALLGVLLKRPIHFFTRGDIFMGRFVNRVLALLNMIPVHHHVGKNDAGANDQSFLVARGILQKGGVILFFPEGNSHIERKLKPFRKGVFRLAFQSATLDNTLNDLRIIPVGINYTHPFAYRQDIFVHAGKALFVNDYYAEYQRNQAAALLRITKNSFESLSREVIHIPDDSIRDAIQQVLEIKRNECTPGSSSWLQYGRERLNVEQAICRQVSSMAAAEKASLCKCLNDYFVQLRTFGIRDSSLVSSKPFHWYQYLVLTLGLPLYCLGYLLNGLPLLIAQRIADTRVSRIDFYSWIFLAFSAVLYAFWITVLGAGFLAIVGWKYTLCVIITTLLTGWFAILYDSSWKQYIMGRTINRFKKADPASIEKLHTLRNSLKFYL